MMRRMWYSFFLFLFTATVAVGQGYVYHNEWIDYNKTYYKFKVMGFGTDNVGAPITHGMVRIPYSTIASAGLAGTSAEHFQLWRDGEEVPIYVSKINGVLGNTDYIEFLGEINNGKLDKELYRNPDFQLSDKWSLQTDTAAYFLTINTSLNNVRITDGGNTILQNTVEPDKYFMYTVGRHFRNTISNGFAASLAKSLYSSSYDRGEGWVSRAVRPVAGCGSATLPQGFSGLYPFLDGPKMTVRVHAVGDKQNNRTVRIDFNNDSVTTFQMDYVNYVKDEQLVDVRKLSTGVGTIYVINKSPNGCDEMRVSMVELTYPRLFDLGGSSFFKFALDASSKGRYLAITNFNFSGTAPVLYDVANKRRYPVNASNTDTLKVWLDASPVPYDLVLTTQVGNYYKAITNLEKRNFIDYNNPANQGDYLIISNPLIYGSESDNYVQQYSQYRSSVQGGLFRTKVIDINELVDQFAWGIKKHPLSVKNFLRFARKAFTETPKYVFLIGKGVIYNDYRLNENNALAEQLNLVPTFGNPASDNLLASEDFSATPETPIGRLSAVNNQEVGDYLQKVKEYDSVQHNAPQTIEAKGWMKNVIQIAGANDASTSSQVDDYMAAYKKIMVDTLFGASVKDFSKASNPDGYPEAINSFKQVYENGASLITYFGHSSSTSLDFNLDNPEAYNNAGKYPVFIANGCSAGDHFLFEPDRLTTKSTISEKFIFSPQRGAIGYLASTNFGVLNYLHLYTLDFYKAFAKTKYNQSIGTVIKEAIASSLSSISANDFYSRVHAEQYAYHGDPAIKMNASSLPDFTIEPGQVQVKKSFVSVADTSFEVTMKVYNIGRATAQPVTLKIIRETSGGGTSTILTKTFNYINYLDSVSVNIPIISTRDKGINKITAVVDFANSVTELNEENNQATIEVLVSEDEIRPVFPFNYAVVTSPVLKLTASTVNPLQTSREYLMEIDTTALFNSSLKAMKTKISTGGVIEFDPGITFQSGVTYFWRVAPASQVHINWVAASFVYKSKSIAGYEQAHLYQHLQSQFTHLSLDSASRKFGYKSKLHNLFISNSIYPTSGIDNDHFSISVDGSNYIQSACVGHSIIFNVFDPITFRPTENSTSPFGAAAVCDPTRKYNFEYEYTSSTTRKNAVNFLDAIPKGSYVAVRLILDQPYNSFASSWAADTSLYGKENSLYHRLKQHGFKAIDSFYYARTWAFVFKKDDTTFTPTYALSQGLYDRITLSVNCTTPNTQGYIQSPVFGPAKEWKNVYWNGYSVESGNDVSLVNVYGVRGDNSDTLLYQLDTTRRFLDMSAVSAIQFPYIRFQMSTADSITATPYQLSKWGVGYVPVPEGAIAPNLHYNIPDTIGTLNGASYTGMLHAAFAFKNVSKADFDSISVKVVLFDSLNNVVNYPIQKLRPLPGGDTVHVNLALDVSTLNGWYNLYVQVNPPNAYQPEQFSFNNFLYKRVFIDRARVMPVTLLNFAAVRQGGNVSTSWSVAEEVNTRGYDIEHSFNGSQFEKIGHITSTALSAGVSKNYSFLHANANLGKNFYRLKMIDRDGTYSYSQIRLVIFMNGEIVPLYPNPVKEMLNIGVSRHDGKTVDIRILNAFGQQLWQQKVSGNVQVNTTTWASGTYFINVTEGKNLRTYKVQKQ